jgi:hypothetical protein
MRLNKPSPRLQILREQLAREKFSTQNARELYAHSAANPRTTHHYHPDYNADLADMWPEKPASKTPQPAVPATQPSQPSASAWRIGTDIPVRERVGLWHYQDDGRHASNAKVAGNLLFAADDRYRPAAPGTKEGDPYDESRYTDDLSARLADAGSAASVDGDGNLRHLVCVYDKKAHTGRIYEYPTAKAAKHAYDAALKTQDMDWRLCDKDGWIPHTPTAVSTCPVPPGVAANVRWRNGSVHKEHTFFRWDDQDGDGKAPSDIVAWRPVSGGAAS